MTGLAESELAGGTGGVSPDWRRWRNLVVLVRAMWRLAYHTRGFRLGRSVPDLHRSLTGRGSPVSDFSDSSALIRARQLELLVSLAAQLGPFPGTCLSRSLVLLELLGREGIDASLRIGVRQPGPELEAHAWVEHRGVVLNDATDLSRRFTPFRRATKQAGGGGS